MKMRSILFLTAALAVSFLVACQPLTTNTNVGNANMTNMNSDNMNAANANMNASDTNSLNNMSSAIEADEPEVYQATVTLKAETTGKSNMNFPPIQAQVARDGADRRMEFTLPNGQKLIYLDLGGKTFVISPARKEYAELNKESTGFDVRSLMLPSQIVNQVKNLKGVEKVGEEKVDGRDVIKYRYGTTTQTNTKAGDVETESYILVDKETNLPLRSVSNAKSEGQDVQGVKGVQVVTEMSNIKTDVDKSLFAEPTDYKKVSPEQIKGQINMLFNIATGVIGQIMQNAQTAATPTP